jgi:hypothetical protein
MKSLAVLLVAVALVAPAVAQNTALQDYMKKHKSSLVASATKPILLHTGKPITADDKKQLLEKATKAYKNILPTAGVKVKIVNAPLPATYTLTPQTLYVKGIADVEAADPYDLDPGENRLSLGGTTGVLYIHVNTTPNTAYTLIFNVQALDNGGTYTLQNIGASADNNGAYPALYSENFPSGMKESNQYAAYTFTSNSNGFITISLYNANAGWNFKSCEVTANPIN